MKLALVILLQTTVWISAAPSTIWVEGESSADQTIQKNGWYSSVKKDELSDGGLLAHWGDRPGQAQYKVTIPGTGTYTLWLRANTVGSKIEIRFDGDRWKEINPKGNSHENINIASDNKPDLRFLSWINAGTTNLKAGVSGLSVRFTSDNHNHGMLDCFCLTTDPSWKPSRTLKPGEKPPHWPTPRIDDSNLQHWIQFVRPAPEELGWRQIRWHSSLSEAAKEAEQLQRPILLWAMNGHPCGET
ncbi:MAG: hypothetical protein ACSHYF_05305 [Verrucomicrobiaceae bacterium]